MLAEAYALNNQRNLTHLVLASTFHSTRQLNAVFRRMMEAMTPELRDRIERMERAGLWQRLREEPIPGRVHGGGVGRRLLPDTNERRPDPNYDAIGNGVMSWDLYRTMWGSHGEFVIDGNLTSVEYADRLATVVGAYTHHGG